MKAIMYHYVRFGDSGLPYFRYLHVDDFVRQLDYFEDKYGFVDREEFIESVTSATPKSGVLLTFDDGFKDHYKFVYPELRKRNLWGIFYIPTYPLIAGKLLGVHRVHMLLGKYGGHKIAEAIRSIVTDDMLSHAHIDEFHCETYTRQDNSASTNYVKRLLNYFIDYSHRGSVLDELMSLYFPNELELVKDFYVGEADLMEMYDNGMIIGSHTVTHPVMSKLSSRKQEDEIEQSFRLIEAITGQNNLRTFCYPYGGFHSFTNETERLLERHGCLFSFNVESRDVERRDMFERRQALPRYDCNEFPCGTCRNMV